LVEGMQEQLGRETDLRQEASNLALAAEKYEQVNATLGERFGGWKFSVPRLVEDFVPTDSVLVMERAQGVALEKLPPKDAQLAGEALTRGFLQMFFRHGVLNREPQRGNYLADVHSKTISPLDFGAVDDFSPERFLDSYERALMGQLMEALKKRNPDKVVELMRLLSGANLISAEERRELVRKVNRLLDGSQDLVQKLPSLIGIFVSSPIHPRERHSVGAFKALYTLAREDFATTDFLMNELNREVTRSRGRDAPKAAVRRVLCSDAIRSMSAQVNRRLRSFGRSQN